ncbi:hypothetical protein ACFL5X_00740 [Candidatus Omnitrophota bacterium]
MEEQDKGTVKDEKKDLVTSLFYTLSRLVNKLRLQLDFPAQTLTFNREQPQTWWHMINIGEIGVMQAVCKFEVTNIAKNFDIRPVAALLKKSRTFGMIRVGSDDGVISCNWTLPIEFEFWVKKPFKKKQQGFFSDIIIYDQFNHAHVLKNIHFEYR